MMIWFLFHTLLLSFFVRWFDSFVSLRFHVSIHFDSFILDETAIIHSNNIQNTIFFSQQNLICAFFLFYKKMIDTIMIVFVVIRFTNTKIDWKRKKRIESMNWVVRLEESCGKDRRTDKESWEDSACAHTLEHNPIGNLYGLVSIRFDSIRYISIMALPMVGPWNIMYINTQSQKICHKFNFLSGTNHIKYDFHFF